MLQRIWLFLLTNIAVVFILNIILLILEKVFGIQLYGYGYYLFVAAIIWFAGSFISLFLSKWMAKRAYPMTMITQENLSQLDEKERVVWDTVIELSERENIKTPEVGIYSSAEPNAFATGATKNSSLVAVSTGLLEFMTKDQIEWVVAHEMAHVLNGDMVTMTLLQWVVNTFVIFAAKVLANIASQFVDENIAGIVRFVTDIALQIFFWVLASLITMKFSRWREYRADAGSAKFVGKEKMIAGLQALKKMQVMMKPDSQTKMATMKISSGKRKGFMELFSSHPDLDDRIKALENLQLH